MIIFPASTVTQEGLESGGKKKICGMYAFFQNAYGVTAFDLVLLFISGRDYHP